MLYLSDRMKCMLSQRPKKPHTQCFKTEGPLALENSGGPSERLIYGSERPLKIIQVISFGPVNICEGP